MKCAIRVALSIVVGLAGLLSAAIVGWATWVVATGNGWLLDLMFNTSSPTKPWLLLCCVFGFSACLSLWGVKKIFSRATS
jgi:hypothetical protein